jgi:outer membrane protein
MQQLSARLALSTLLFSVTLLFATHAPAQAPAPQAAPVGRTVTLPEVIKRARENPPLILAALATLQRIQAQEQYARGAYIPRFTIEAGSGIAYNNTPFLPQSQIKLYERERQAAAAMNLPPPGQLPTTIDSASQTTYGRANIDYALLDLGRRYAVKSAELATTAQREAYSEAQRAAAQAAGELYMRAVASVALAEDARLTLERRTSQYNAINGLVRAGLRPSVDATRAQIEVTAAKYALETREIEVSASGAALAAAVGEDPTKPLRAAEFDDAVLPAPLDPLPASVRAIERRPEIRQLEMALESRRVDHKAAITARLPTAGISGTGNVSYNDLIQGDGYQGRSLSGAGSLYMRWAALDPAIWRRANVTRSAMEEAQRQLESQLLAIRAEVVEAAYTVKRTRALLEQTTQILESAQAARTAQNERYRAGVASLLDLLDAEGVEQNARRQRIEATRDHRVARVALLALCGTIDKLGQ